MPLPPILVADLFPKVSRRLVELLRSLSADEWHLPTISSRRTVKDIASHLLDGSLRRLSMQRDGHRPADGRSQPRADEPLMDFLNRLNDEWETGTRRLSPKVLVDLIERADAQLADLFQSLDPHGRGEGLHRKVASHAANLRRHKPVQHDSEPTTRPSVSGHLHAGIAVHVPQRRSRRGQHRYCNDHRRGRRQLAYRATSKRVGPDCCCASPSGSNHYDGPRHCLEARYKTPKPGDRPTTVFWHHDQGGRGTWPARLGYGVRDGVKQGRRIRMSRKPTINTTPKGRTIAVVGDVYLRKPDSTRPSTCSSAGAKSLRIFRLSNFL